MVASVSAAEAPTSFFDSSTAALPVRMSSLSPPASVVFWSADEASGGSVEEGREAPLRPVFISPLPPSPPTVQQPPLATDYYRLHTSPTSTDAQRASRGLLWNDSLSSSSPLAWPHSPPAVSQSLRLFARSTSCSAGVVPFSSAASSSSPSESHSLTAKKAAQSDQPPVLAVPAADLPCPAEQSIRAWQWWRWPSLLYFGWLTPLLRLGVKRPLQQSDLWDIWTADKADNVWNEFEAGWEAELQRARTAQRPPNLLHTLVRVYGPAVLLTMLVYSYTVADALLGPQFLNWLVNYSEAVSEGQSVSPIEGYKYCLLLFGSLALAAVCRVAAAQLTLRLFLRVRNAVILALYRKSLRVASRHREDGKLNNIMATDSEMLLLLGTDFHSVWSAPIIIGVGMWELYVQVGWSAFVGLAVIIASFPFTALLMRSYNDWTIHESSATDRRISLTNELVAAMRLVKYYAWERPFVAKLSQAREEQLVWLRKMVLASCLFFALLGLVPLFVSVAVFAIYAGTGGDMSPSVVFTSLTLIAIIRNPFMLLSNTSGTLVHVVVSMRRITQFLSKPDIDTTRIAVLPDAAIRVEGAQFDWESTAQLPADSGAAADEHSAKTAHNSEKDDSASNNAATSDTTTQTERLHTEATDKSSEQQQQQSEEVGGDIDAAEDTTEDKARSGAAPPILTDVTFTVSPGELVMVIGTIGSGKSSLLCGLLGEVERTAGRVAVGGKLGYVPQTAFIINATVRDNIVFGQPYDPIRYRQCVAACALDADMAQLPSGDMTEIGERGINLSGGQKQRVSIARAAYAADCSVVLMDDPLSAVDAHVGHHIFHRCINGPAMEGRTRLLVTHSLAYVDYASKIVLMKPTSTPDCYTVKLGTAASLRTDDEQFRALLDAYNRGKECESEREEGQARQSEKEDGQHSSASRVGEDEEETWPAEDEERSDELISDTAPSGVAGSAVSSTTAALPAAGGALMEAEERTEGQVTWSVYRHYLAAGGGVCFYACLLLAFCAAQGVQTASDFWLAKWTNSIPHETGAESSSHSTGYWLGVYGALAFGALLATTVRTWGVSVASIRASRQLHHELLHSVVRRSISWFDRTPAGRITNRFTRDLGNIDVIIAPTLEYYIAPLLSIVGTIVVIAIIVPLTLAVFAPLVPLFLLIAFYYRRSNIELRRLESLSRSPIFAHFAETLNGSVTIRALRAQRLYTAENSKRVNVNTRALYYSRAVSQWMRVRLDLIAAVAVGASAVLAVGSEHAGFWSLSPGNFGLLLSYALSLIQLLTSTVVTSTAAEAQMNSVERVKAYSAPTNHEQWEATDKRLSDSVQDCGWPNKGRVQLKGLQLRYRDDLDLVLRGVDVDIAGGSRVAIVGRTGSGKSSLLVALFRMVEPCAGDMLVDGVSLQQLSLEDVRSRLSILPQEAVLVTGTLRHNLDPFGQHADNELWDALRVVQLEPLVRRMAAQLDSAVAESGAVLSAGQKQLLCLARALLRRPKVLCLDEATANVDLATDEVIQRVIREQLGATNTTVITIAHRIHTVLDYDTVLVMDGAGSWSAVRPTSCGGGRAACLRACWSRVAVQAKRWRPVQEKESNKRGLHMCIVQIFYKFI